MKQDNHLESLQKSQQEVTIVTSRIFKQDRERWVDFRGVCHSDTVGDHSPLVTQICVCLMNKRSYCFLCRLSSHGHLYISLGRQKFYFASLEQKAARHIILYKKCRYYKPRVHLVYCKLFSIQTSPVPSHHTVRIECVRECCYSYYCYK